MTGTPHWSVESHADPTELFRAAAAHVARRAHEAVRENSRFTFAVSGGRTPWLMFAELVHEDMPWDRTDIFQVDERITGPEDPDRNLLHLHQALGDAPAHVHPMPVEADDLEAAARQYAEELPARFDLIHLGLGPDGHTASLVPGDPILEVIDQPVAITTHPYQGHRRMSLTYPTLDAARHVLWLVTGADKAQALRQLLEHDVAIPAGRVSAEDNLIVTDPPAEGR